jgi:hypothetical protein
VVEEYRKASYSGQPRGVTRSRAGFGTAGAPKPAVDETVIFVRTRSRERGKPHPVGQNRRGWSLTGWYSAFWRIAIASMAGISGPSKQIASQDGSSASRDTNSRLNEHRISRCDSTLSEMRDTAGVRAIGQVCSGEDGRAGILRDSGAARPVHT